MGRKKTIILIILLMIAVGVSAFLIGQEYVMRNEEPLNDCENVSDKEEVKQDDYGEMMSVSNNELVVAYNKKQFVLSGFNSDCEVSDNLYNKTYTLAKDEIVSVKLMPGFLSDALEVVVIITNTGEVYSTSFLCDGELFYTQPEIFKGYEVKDVLSVATPSCGEGDCYQTAKVVLKDGTVKELRYNMR